MVRKYSTLVVWTFVALLPSAVSVLFCDVGAVQKVRGAGDMSSVGSLMQVFLVQMLPLVVLIGVYGVVRYVWYLRATDTRTSPRYAIQFLMTYVVAIAYMHIASIISPSCFVSL